MKLFILNLTIAYICVIFLFNAGICRANSTLFSLVLHVSVIEGEQGLTAVHHNQHPCTEGDLVRKVNDEWVV